MPVLFVYYVYDSPTYEVANQLICILYLETIRNIINPQIANKITILATYLVDPGHPINIIINPFLRYMMRSTIMCRVSLH